MPIEAVHPPADPPFSEWVIGRSHQDALSVLMDSQGLKEAGYAEGETVVIEYRWAENQIDRLPALAAELVRRKVAVLVANGPAAFPAKAATTTIPIVFTIAQDPVKLGLVASLARPGGNVTGVSRQTPELVGKQLQLLKETLPRTTRVGVLLNPTDRLHSVIVGAVTETAESLGVKLNILGPNAPAEFEGAFSTLRRAAD